MLHSLFCVFFLSRDWKSLNYVTISVNIIVCVFSGGLEDWFCVLLDWRPYTCSSHSHTHGFTSILLQLQRGPPEWRDCLPEERPHGCFLLHFLSNEILPNESSEEDLSLLSWVSLMAEFLFRLEMFGLKLRMKSSNKTFRHILVVDVKLHVHDYRKITSLFWSLFRIILHHSLFVSLFLFSSQK